MPLPLRLTRRLYDKRLCKQPPQAGRHVAGKAYTEGGKTISGFDCSGFVYYVFHEVFTDYTYLDTNGIQTSPFFNPVATPQAGDLIFFPKAKNPYEVNKGNKKEFPNHVGIVLDSVSWIGSQSSTGVAKVQMNNVWWSSRPKIYLRYKKLAG